MNVLLRYFLLLVFGIGLGILLFGIEKGVRLGVFSFLLALIAKQMFGPRSENR